MRREPFDFTLRPLDHLLQIDDELVVNWVVGGSESVEGGSAGSVKNPEHREMFVGVSRHLGRGMPGARFLELDSRFNHDA